ncbi:ADP-ribosylglycohydrolase family protein [Saccharopolyspora sp. WRP15-2]|uniref:ADP-ribosylglycohydrolase family protein n=1 Tax=Saccharopolyspora oryzae TaxID=2997343 RepID=A0ABT4UTH3_9PSEU|nr:ADP-ribosylglycohydrolase family protein [Saccharopolyspora oryzae]MDA3624998.1 ADP-ribosylglycohydrolase family protein [Saccharopolyspora oryzae]
MNDSLAAQGELTPNELKTLQAWRDIKSRPSLLPMSWFAEVDRQVGMVFGGDRNVPLAWPRRQYQVLGRVMGMLVGGALGDSLGAAAEAEGITGGGALLAALRSRQWRAPNSAALVSAVEIAIRAHSDHGEGEDLDVALMARAREAELGGTLGCFAASIPAALVSITSPDEDAFRRAAELVGLLSEHSEDRASAGVFAVALVRALNGQNLRLDQISRLLLEQLGTEHPELRRRLDHLAAAGEDVSEQATLVELGDGASGPETVSRALYLGDRNTGGWAEILHAFAGGSRSRNAQVSGLLTGARHGAEAFPLLWRRKLEPVAQLESVAETFMTEFGPDKVRITPQSDARSENSPFQPSALLPAEPAKPKPHERFMGSMLAGAVGDSLGFAIEFEDIGTIRRNHGDAGLTDPVLRDGVAQVSDDTQMMLFTLEGLIRAHVARRMNPVDNDPVPEVQHAYQRWYHTQYQPWDQAGGPYAQRLQQPDGWLITRQELFSTRAPGSTCMSALRKFAQTHQHATPQHTINDSKGCGGVMRAAPVAVWSGDPAEVFYAAFGTAALTHSHPSGYLSAGVLAVIVHQLIRDVSLADSIRLARELLLRWRGHEEQLQVLDKAVELARKGPVSPEELKDTLGQGWVGEEALAIGLYAVLATDNLRDALLLSVNHSGDSDSTGIVAGNIGGALYGTRAIPQEWLNTLELREIVETLAKDALAEFSPGPPSDQAWLRRYPAW